MGKSHQLRWLKQIRTSGEGRRGGVVGPYGPIRNFPYDPPVGAMVRVLKTCDEEEHGYVLVIRKRNFRNMLYG